MPALFLLCSDLLFGLRSHHHFARPVRRQSPARLLRPLRCSALRQSTPRRRNDSRSGATRFCCANERSSRDLANGRCPPASWKSGETTGDGALRETLEEAGARVTLGPLFSMIDVPHVAAGSYLLSSRPARHPLRRRAPRALRCGCSTRARSRGTKSHFARFRPRWSCTLLTEREVSSACTRARSLRR